MVYALAIAAVMLPVLRWLPLMFFAINHEAFNVHILKLLKARNYDRALKLCRAVPSAFYPVMVRSARQAMAKP